MNLAFSKTIIMSHLVLLYKYAIIFFALYYLQELLADDSHEMSSLISENVLSDICTHQRFRSALCILGSLIRIFTWLILDNLG